MRFGVLGPVTAWTDAGSPVVIQGLKVRALLADLLVHEGRPVPGDRLIHDLWGDELPGNPSGTLSAKVSQLRRAFEDAERGSRALVKSGPAGYSLTVDSSSYDALEFADRVAAGELDKALAWPGVRRFRRRTVRRDSHSSTDRAEADCSGDLARGADRLG